MASLYKREYRSKKTGKVARYWFVAYVHEGKRHTKCAGTLKTVARDLKNRIEAELELGKFDFLKKPHDIPVKDSIPRYLEHIKTLRTQKTYTRYENALRHFLRFVEDVYPAVQYTRELTKAQFTEYQGWRRTDEISPNGKKGSAKKKFPTFKTINVELSIFRSWLNWAVVAGHIGENPLHGFKDLKTTDSKPRRILDPMEYKRLIAASLAIEQENPSRQGQTRIWRFLANTGLRVGELTHLQWNDIDLRLKIIKIQRKPDWNPKTYEREVPLTPKAQEVIREIRGRLVDEGSPVFNAGNAKPYRANQLREWLLDCADRAGIKHVRGPHDFRHTFITLALTEFNMPVPVVQKIVGHTKLETTQAYLHPTTDFIRATAQKFEL